MCVSRVRQLRAPAKPVSALSSRDTFKFSSPPELSRDDIKGADTVSHVMCWLVHIF